MLTMRLDQILHQRPRLIGVGNRAVGEQRLDEQLAVALERSLDGDFDRSDLGMQLGNQRGRQAVGISAEKPPADRGAMAPRSPHRAAGRAGAVIGHVDRKHLALVAKERVHDFEQLLAFARHVLVVVRRQRVGRIAIATISSNQVSPSAMRPSIEKASRPSVLPQ